LPAESTVMDPFAHTPAVALRRLATTSLIAAALWLPGAAAAQQPSQPSASGPTLDAVHALEQQGRIDPEQALARLQRMLPLAPAGGHERVELLTVLGLIHGARREAAQVHGVVEQLQALGGDAARAAALVVHAGLDYFSGDLSRAEPQLTQALAMLPADAPPQARFRVLYQLTQIQAGRGRIEQALASAHEAIRVADGTGAALLRSSARSQLAYVLLRGGQLQRAHDLSREAVALAPTDAERSSARQVEAMVLARRNDPRGEREATLDALQLARRAGWRSQEGLMLGNLADSYLARAEYETARRHAAQALVIARELKDSPSESLALTNLGLAEIGLKRLDAGRAHIERALVIERNAGARAEEAEVLDEMGAALERAGDWAGAIDAYHRLRELQDAMAQTSRQRALLEMQERFDNESRARELALLQREGALHDAQLQAQVRHRWLWAAVALACGLALALVIVLARRLRHANRRLIDSNARLRQQAGCDPLTGLANRRFAHEVMQQQAGASFEGTLLLIDLDHFKRINDTAGHAAGDAVLVEAGRRLRDTLREGDQLARWGGEEFLIAVQPALQPEQAELLAERLLHRLGDTPVVLPAHTLRLTASIGFASFPPPGGEGLAVPWERALRLADSLMYAAKARGRNRACGLRALRLPGEAGLARAETALDAAERQGEVVLAEIAGPTAGEARAGSLRLVHRKDEAA
jgi:diguanylate cyclase (GGDEF)-like protein